MRTDGAVTGQLSGTAGVVPDKLKKTENNALRRTDLPPSILIKRFYLALCVFARHCCDQLLHELLMSQLISVAMDWNMLCMLRWLDAADDGFDGIHALRCTSPNIYSQLRCFKNQDGFGFTVGHCGFVKCHNCLLVSTMLASEFPAVVANECDINSEQ